MSSKQFKLLSEKQSENLAQIIQNFFVKSACIIVGARASVSECSDEASSLTHRTNRWFNIELDESSSIAAMSSEELKLWKTKDILLLPPLVVETVLDLRGLEPNQTLVIDDGTIIKTDKKLEIVLERWLIEFDLTSFDNDSIELPTIYKKLIILFRSLYTLVRLLPAYGLRNSFMKSTQSSSNLSLKANILDGTKSISSKGRIGLSKSFSEASGENHLASRRLTSVLTPIGALKISSSYRINCHFEVRDNEELLSNQFMMEKNSSQESIISAVRVLKEPTYGSDRDASLPIHQSTSPLSIGSSHSREQKEPPGQQNQTQILTQSPKRRSSIRSVPLFKGGSIASSASPPVSQLPASVTSKGSPGPSNGASSYVTSKPIPVTLNRTRSNTSVVLRNQQTRDSFNRSVSSFNTSFGSVERQQQLQQHETGTTPVPSGYQMLPTLSSASSKFPSSFGSRFRGSRQNSVSSQLAGTNNPVLQNFKLRSKTIASSESDSGPTNSMYLDDDLDSFVKMLDSKPDLRLASGSTTITGGSSDQPQPASSTIFDDSLREFKQFQKRNDLFNDRVASSSSLPLRRGSSERYTRSISPGNMVVSATPRSIPTAMQSPGWSQRRSSAASSSYSPSIQFMKLGSSSGPVGPTLSPVVSYANRFSASSSGETSVVGILRRKSSAASSHSRYRGMTPARENSTSHSTQNRSSLGNYSSRNVSQREVQRPTHSGASLGSRKSKESQGSRDSHGSRSSRGSESPGDSQLVDPEFLKLRSYNEQVFESDGEDDNERNNNSLSNHDSPQSEDRKLSPSGLTTKSPFVPHGPANLHQLAIYRRQGSSDYTHNRNEDDEDELLFAMSDMTLAKNNVDF
ncbi:hypothetical protein FOA43_001150 [Brettanomyces nanus]|uniref:Autophagy-related protein 13 n=1 Tax=Eeniella nana TaxID=13502 RepID=A0A875S0I9_EENNA|nr:uncharacterized protein FOA43_001150 [Brettanomyces nanus]QPG73835.1 hypothetical protein FOA43_001150 [Brettanomyces nanus]